MAGSFLHIELDTQGLTAAIVNQRNKPALVKDLCHVQFEDLPDTDKNKSPFDAGMEIAVQKLDLKMCSTAVIFISPFLVSFRNISLPFNSEKKIEQVLSFELETILPHSKKDYISDFHMLNIEDKPHPILTASVLESDIETLFTGLKKYNIKPVIITHKGYAAALDFLKTHADVRSCVFLYITNTAHTLVLVINQTPCVVKVLSTRQSSPETLVTSINRTIIGFEQRTGLKTDFDLFIRTDGSGEDIESIKKSFKNPSQLRSIEPEIHTAMIQEKTNEAPALLSDILPDKKINYLFNFCKNKYGTSSLFETYSNYIAVGLIFAFLTFSLAIMNFNIDISKFESKIAALDYKSLSIFSATFPETKKVMNPHLQMKANVLAALKKSGANGDRINAFKDVTIIEIINELSQKIESSIDMEISRFLFNENRIVISGSTNNFNTVDKIKNKLEASDLFGNVSISSAAADKKEDRVNFKFIIEI